MKGVAADVKRDAVLLRFQLTAEIMPKMLRRILEKRGLDVVLPKDVVRHANAGGIITETAAKVMLAVIDDRNRMVHDYNESFAKELYKRITKTYSPALQSLSKMIAGGDSR